MPMVRASGPDRHLAVAKLPQRELVNERSLQGSRSSRPRNPMSRTSLQRAYGRRLAGSVPDRQGFQQPFQSDQRRDQGALLNGTFPQHNELYANFLATRLIFSLSRSDVRRPMTLPFLRLCPKKKIQQAHGNHVSMGGSSPSLASRIFLIADACEYVVKHPPRNERSQLAPHF